MECAITYRESVTNPAEIDYRLHEGRMKKTPRAGV